MVQRKNLRQKLLDQLPGMPVLMNHPQIAEFRSIYPTLYINDMVRRELEGIRRLILSLSEEELPDFELEEDAIALRASEVIRRAVLPSVKPAINAAGVILHTALGRAPLAESAQKAVADALKGYCTLAINEETGRRGDRHLHLEHLIAHITGAESGIMVNNNAAATMLILNTLAAGKEVIVSRGQLIEIGGAFRIPEVMERSGCKLVEVGTTNRTHLRDYENAITDETAAILRVHSSNYRIIGFTGEVPLPELSELGRKHDLPVIDDLGSGALVDLSAWGLPKEPMVQESLRDGMDAICFSGDKMLGGPQGGYIIGKKGIIDRVKKNPLMRALRCDKMSYATAEATLKLYLEPEKLPQTHPVIGMITAPADSVRRRTLALRRRLASQLKDRAQMSVEADQTEMGSGSLPGKGIPTFVLKVIAQGFSPDDVAKSLRLGSPPIFARISGDALLFDLRTVFKSDERALVDGIVAALQK